MTVFVGDILNATPATVIANPASTRTWRWLRNGVAIPGFTGTSYRVTGLDTGAPIAVQQIETNLMGSSSAVSVNTANVGAWTPSTIFSASEPGVWYDTDDYTAMFQDSTGNTPITGAGQPVGLLLDKSKGLALGSNTASNDLTTWVKAATATTPTSTTATFPAANDYIYTSASTAAGKVYEIKAVLSGSGTIVFGIYGNVTGFVPSTPNVALTATPTEYTLVRFFQSTDVDRRVVIGRIGGAAATSVTVSSVSVREITGNHATSSGDSRPRTVIRPMNAERRNLLTQTEEFENAVWTTTAVGLSAFGSGSVVNTTATLDPIGGNTADFIREDTSLGVHQTSHLLASVVGSRTFSIYVKWPPGVTRNISMRPFNTSSAGNNRSVIFSPSGEFVAFTGTSGADPTYSALNIGNGWWRFSVTAVATQVTTLASATIGMTLGDSLSPYTGDGTSGIYIWGAQVETGSSTTPYQRVVTTNEWYDPTVPSYRGIQFDGVDDFLVTSTISPGTDKAQIFAGVRKLSDAAAGMLAELSADYNAYQGSFYLVAPDTSPTRYGSSSRGNNAPNAGHAANTTLGNAPDTVVLTSTHDIAGDLTTIRRNGVAGPNATADKGTGDFRGYPIYIGRRGGSTLPYNGILTSFVVRFGPNLSTSNINRAEYYVSEKTGVTLT